MFQDYFQLNGNNSFHHFSKETGFPDWKRAKEFPECVFVFGSNNKGIHGAGSAFIAKKHFGAKQGVGRGIQGNSYAIATLPRPYQPALPIDDIKEQIEDFSIFTFCNPDRQFIVTAVGTGFAQIPPEVIAPMFNIGCINCWFPIAWKPYLTDI